MNGAGGVRDKSGPYGGRRKRGPYRRGQIYRAHRRGQIYRAHSQISENPLLTKYSYFRYSRRNNRSNFDSIDV